MNAKLKVQIAFFTFFLFFTSTIAPSNALAGYNQEPTNTGNEHLHTFDNQFADDNANFNRGDHPDDDWDFGDDRDPKPQPRRGPEPPNPPNPDDDLLLGAAKRKRHGLIQRQKTEWDNPKFWDLDAKLFKMAPPFSGNIAMNFNQANAQRFTNMMQPGGSAGNARGAVGPVSKTGSGPQLRGLVGPVSKTGSGPQLRGLQPQGKLRGGSSSGSGSRSAAPTSGSIGNPNAFGPAQGETEQQWINRLAQNHWEATYNKVLQKRAEDRARKGVSHYNAQTLKYQEQEDIKWAKYEADLARQNVLVDPEYRRRRFGDATPEQLAMWNSHRDGTRIVGMGMAKKGKAFGPQLDFTKSHAADDKHKADMQASNDRMRELYAKKKAEFEHNKAVREAQKAAEKREVQDRMLQRRKERAAKRAAGEEDNKHRAAADVEVTDEHGNKIKIDTDGRGNTVRTETDGETGKQTIKKTDKDGNETIEIVEPPKPEEETKKEPVEEDTGIKGVVSEGDGTELKPDEEKERPEEEEIKFGPPWWGPKVPPMGGTTGDTDSDNDDDLDDDGGGTEGPTGQGGGTGTGGPVGEDDFDSVVDDLQPTHSTGGAGDFPVPDSEERDMAAAMAALLDDDVSADDYQDKAGEYRENIDKVHEQHDKAQAASDAEYEEQQGEADQAAADKAAREEGYAKHDEQRDLDRARADALREQKNTDQWLEKRAKDQGRDLTPEEAAISDKYMERANELLQPTPEESAKMEASQKTKDSVNSEIDRLSDHVFGGTSVEDERNRQNTSNMFDAATKDWRDKVSATGEMADHVSKDMTEQRERKIKAENDLNAVDMFLKNNPNATPEEVRFANQRKDQAQLELAHANEAMAMNTGLLAGGATVDVFTLGTGKPAQSAGKALNKALTGAGKGADDAANLAGSAFRDAPTQAMTQADQLATGFRSAETQVMETAGSKFFDKAANKAAAEANTFQAASAAGSETIEETVSGQMGWNPHKEGNRGSER